MKYSRALAGLLTVALSSPVFADECSDNCTELHDACVAAPGANHASCAADYAGCLGYNPYEGDVFTPPTACATATSVTATGTAAPAPTGDACLHDCQDKYDECVNTPGADIPTCDEAVGSCRVSCAPPATPCEEKCDDNYDACISGAGSITSVCEEGRFICKSQCTGPTPTPTPDTCAAACAKKHDACSSAPGANQATCASEYADCLGYNPYDGGFVEPTACSTPIKTMTTMPGPKKTVTPEVCCVACTTTYTTCCAAAGAVIEVCKTEYTSCLGYSPFDVVPWVEPTACVIVVDKPVSPPSKPMPPKTETPEVCCASCTKTYTTCCAASGAVIETCKTEYTSCLGYNPFDVIPWIEPTACVIIVDKPQTPSKPGQPPVQPPVKPPTDNKPSPPKDNHPTPPKGGSSSSSDSDACCVACTKTYKTCCDAPGAVVDTCKTEYCSCLGYNPFEVIPWVEPTTCVVVTKPKPTGGNTPVIVSGGERIQPALALIALGAAVFF